jgi:hypothetical protein
MRTLAFAAGRERQAADARADGVNGTVVVVVVAVVLVLALRMDEVFQRSFQRRESAAEK